jgi:hypothetical protein
MYALAQANIRVHTLSRTHNKLIPHTQNSANGGQILESHFLSIDGEIVFPIGQYVPPKLAYAYNVLREQINSN